MLAERAKTGLITVGVFTAVIWAVYVVNFLAGSWLIRWLAIEPRRFEGLDGVIFAPLLHANLGHLLSNTLPLIVLGFLTFLEGVRRFAIAVASAWLTSGIGVWLLGGGPTIGSSGVVFGLFAYLIVRGFYNRNWRQILLAAMLFLVYGSILWGVLPIAGSNISWQAHLFGAAGGVLAAVIMRKITPPAQQGRTV